MRLARVSGVWIACILMLQGAAATVIWTPTIGSQSEPPIDLYNYAKMRTTGLDLEDPEEIRLAIRDVSNHGRGNATRLVENVDQSGNLSATVRGAYANVRPTGSISGVRTHLEVARSPTGLSSAVIDLYAEVGNPLTLSQRLTVISAASEVPADVATAAALLIYAIIDAREYHMPGIAAAGDDIGPVRGNVSTVATLQRRMEFDPDGSDLVLRFGEEDQSIIDAVNAASDAYGLSRAYLAADVIAQAVDEIKSLGIDEPGQGTMASPCGSSSYFFAVPNTFPLPCLVVIGDSTSNTYSPMKRGGVSDDDDENVLVFDVGGDDTYRHRAGGGTRLTPVQVNVDLGGNDAYDRSIANRGAAHGSGLEGVGFLYDASGNDRYQAHSYRGGDKDAVSQGAAVGGAGLLFDDAGDDVYITLDQGYSSVPHSAHAQGVAIVGFGMLRDLAGSDKYFFNVTGETRHIAGTGAQGFAAGPTSAGYLLDFGSGDDSYSGGQDAVQGAAALHGFAMLHDDGGSNEFQILAALGCLRLYGESCAQNPAQYVPIGGWGQGYANTNGTAVLFAGAGDDVFRTLRLEGYSESYQARSILAAANTSGLAVLVNLAGEDEYDADADALAFGDAGVAVFTDAGDNDHYLCSSSSCYGYGMADGRGIFRDHCSEEDFFADGQDHTTPLASNDLGLGVQEDVC